ncbi:hypothetical protein CDO52_21655 [Nocardiopsis gilva YIM 90087]|uniref:Uncharacterized protein n=1 Tax=Nocardiopsis gilva YIM 90087 TaxID=1235441 RepID=A0A223SAC6_9ACTN|nr:hypothetical protein [Nocardiopsis gilva]ASU85053.1 hypothetical protein CDO52_21655 [Nocardiopsis gilva YIM 90087]
MSQELPRSVKWIRILLFVLAGLNLVAAVGVFFALGADAFAFGYALFQTIPGVVFLLLGLWIRKKGRLVFGGIVAVASLFTIYILLTLAGDSTVTQLLLPVLILILVMRPSSRAYFLHS